jgi:malonyl-CoA/methylmalonyl-CoA synthetase
MEEAGHNVYGVLAQGFPAERSRLFIESFDGRCFTYAEADAATVRLAGLLRRQGLGPGSHLAVVVDKSPESILLYLAACRVGAVFIPVHIGLAGPEIDYVLGDAQPGMVVCAPALADSLVVWPVLFTLDAHGGGSLIEAAGAGAGDAVLARMGAGDANAIVYTSGTTGRPKGAIMTGGLVTWNARSLAARWGMTQDDVLLHANPMAFGLFGTTTPVLAAGAALRLLPKFAADEVIAVLPEVTMVAGVPTYYSRLLQSERFTRALCRGVRLFVTGSAPMRADLFAAFTERTGHLLLDRYGSTEALIVTSMAAGGPRLADRSGTALDGAKLRVVDPQGAPVPPGTVGSIEVWQPYMFAGYWEDAAKTAAAFTEDGWFITGDFGSVDAGGMLSVLGRGADLIITGGLNVYPKEVETRLNALEAVEEAAVIGVPHPDFGEAVVAVVQLKQGSTLDPGEAIARLVGQMAKYKLPKHIAVVAELPRNTLGKVQKKQLRDERLGLFTVGPVGGAV